MLKRPDRIVLFLCVGLFAAPLTGQSDRPDTAGRIVGAALVESRAWEKLAWLSDHIGQRFTGTPGLERAIDWAVAEFERDGMDRVWTDEVQVPRWIRGEAQARIVTPAVHPIALLALGGSVPTPTEGLTAQVVIVSDFDELAELGEEGVRGKIVLFHRPIQPGFSSRQGYGSAVGLRTRGASEAAALGATGMLIRSLGTADYRLPHTGALAYSSKAPRIPAAAIAAEDADLIQRLLDSGEPVEVELKLSCRREPDTTSRNVLAELTGREFPEEIVLIAAHLDSWDVGTGALDDGAGCATVMEALRLLRQHGFRPRRTIRAVLFTNEENGLRGGLDYAERYADSMGLHVAAIESDSGAGTPTGFGITAGDGALAMIEQITRQLEIIGADAAYGRGGGPDISPLARFGVPQIALVQEASSYFHYHHTAADTLDKVDKNDLDRNVAAMALMAYMLAESETLLPRLE